MSNDNYKVWSCCQMEWGIGRTICGFCNKSNNYPVFKDIELVPVDCTRLAVKKEKLRKFVLNHFYVQADEMHLLDMVLDLMIEELENNYQDEEISEYDIYDMYDEKLTEVLLDKFTK